VVVTAVAVVLVVLVVPGRQGPGDDAAGAGMVLVVVGRVEAPEGRAGPALDVLDELGARVRVGLLLLNTVSCDYMSVLKKQAVTWFDCQ
jgi:hypothetical protein